MHLETIRKWNDTSCFWKSDWAYYLTEILWRKSNLDFVTTIGYAMIIYMLLYTKTIVINQLKACEELKVIPGEAGFRTDFFQIWNNNQEWVLKIYLYNSVNTIHQ